MTTTIKERPILFSAPMIRAIQDGRKTQTRRRLKNDPPTVIRDIQTPQEKTIVPEWYLTYCPYGQVGDRLWVRETCVIHENKAWYRASGPLPVLDYAWKWRPSIHMPRWASRLTLEITGVRVERVQDISAEDAMAEGCFKLPASGRITDVVGGQYFGRTWPSAKFWFHDVWESIHGDESWALNQWVWVIEFRRLEQ